MPGPVLLERELGMAGQFFAAIPGEGLAPAGPPGKLAGRVIGGSVMASVGRRTIFDLAESPGQAIGIYDYAWPGHQGRIPPDSQVDINPQNVIGAARPWA